MPKRLKRVGARVFRKVVRGCVRWILVVFWGGSLSDVLYAETFFSLRSGEVNLREGPGREYGVTWTFRCLGLPVVSVRECDNWVLVRDHEGTEGWVRRGLLSPRKTLLVINDMTPLRKGKGDDAPLLAHLKKGVVSRVLVEESPWVYVFVLHQDKNYKGWVLGDACWGGKMEPAKRAQTKPEKKEPEKRRKD